MNWQKEKRWKRFYANRSLFTSPFAATILLFNFFYDMQRLQPHLQNELVELIPLQQSDFESLYSVASDPKVWEQHPNRNRWKKEVFSVFFEGALKSNGAFKIIDRSTGKVAGSTRLYDYNETGNSIAIGYTFFGVEYWGSGLNHAAKRLLLDHSFQLVSRVYFYIGAVNIRSQISITRLGAQKTGEQEIAYFGEASNLNYIYTINKDDWENANNPDTF